VVAVIIEVFDWRDLKSRYGSKGKLSFPTTKAGRADFKLKLAEPAVYQLISLWLRSSQEVRQKSAFPFLQRAQRVETAGSP